MSIDSYIEDLHPERPEQSELDTCRRSFNAAPSFTTLRKLAELWTSNQHWELAAEAWLHVAYARPNDAQAYAGAATALSHLAKHADAARLWERACHIQPQNTQYAKAHAQAVRDSLPPIPQTVSSAGARDLPHRSNG